MDSQVLTGTAPSVLPNQKKSPRPLGVSACSALAVVAGSRPPVLRLTDGSWGPSLPAAPTSNIPQRTEDKQVKRALMNSAISKTFLISLLP